jgi:superfamily I DNA/RNA helicase
MKKLRVKDVFAFGRILSRAGLTELARASHSTERELGFALLERILSLPSDAEKDLYALISEVAETGEVETLGIDEFIKLISELVEYNGGIKDFFSKVLSIKPT